ncbi:hypothetical protein F5878DRAFT_661493 [Lentinula raphanica]|uniref:DUF159-domain-containing protein n=1 Tax=Lentinula raphanica TaxID=153919 RepID=A0AA38UEH7_9AGAR|nr:hypothetical protein F5878DRAFT_661493 [Lentinula raphanica]
MCGRFSLRLQPEEIRQGVEEYNLHAHEWIDQDRFVPRYNVAPRTQAPVIRRSQPGNSARPGAESEEGSSSAELSIQTMKWGLVPHWSKFEDKTLNTINARSENLVSGGGMWNSLRGRKRCVVICQGYYEWLSKGKQKVPHFTKPKNGHLMLLAGLYDSVELQDSTEPLWTFSIVTTAASNEFSWLHDRQPVILSTQSDLEQWLDTSSQRWSEDLAQLVSRAYTKDSLLECYPVPKEVGKIGTESSSYILPISERKDGIEAMFSRQKQASTSTKKSSSPPTAKRKRDSERRERTLIKEDSDDEIEILEHPPPSVKKVCNQDPVLIADVYFGLLIASRQSQLDDRDLMIL